MIEYFGGKTMSATGAVIPLSKAIGVPGFIFLSGQLGYDENRKIVTGGIEAQTKATFQNIKRVLEEAGVTLKDVIKCTCWLTQKEDFAAFNKVYASFFPENPPTRSTVRSDLVVEGALVEIEVLAVKEMER